MKSAREIETRIWSDVEIDAAITRSSARARATSSASSMGTDINASVPLGPGRGSGGVSVTSI